VFKGGKGYLSGLNKSMTRRGYSIGNKAIWGFYKQGLMVTFILLMGCFWQNIAS